MRLKRREFLKLAAITAATTAISEPALDLFFTRRAARARKKKSLLEPPTVVPDLEERYFTCRICGGGCVLRGFLDRSGTLVKIEGDPRDWVSHGKPCVKGKTVLRMLYDPDRLRVPLRRTNPDRGFVVGESGELRGVKDPGWVEVSWDEALDDIAEKIAEAIRTWGPQSIVFIGHGRGSALAKLIGTPNVVKHHTTCHSSWDVTLRPMFGGIPNADMANSRLIVSFGFDQGAGKSKNPFVWLFAEAKRRGAEIVVFEPRLSETASKATEWIPIKPGTDLAVVLAIANVIISEGLYDAEFLRRYTNAPILVDPASMRYVKDPDGNLLVFDEQSRSIKPVDDVSRPALLWRGKYSGKDVATALQVIWERISRYTPEWAEKVSGVPASKIHEIARKLATVKPASIPHWKRSGGTGPGRGQGVETYKVIALIMALTGNVERRGGWILGRNAKFITKAISKKPKKTFADLYPIPPKYRGKTVDEREKFPLYSKYTKEGVYQKVWYNILNDNPYPVKVVIVWGQGLQAFMDYSIVEKAVKHVVEDNGGIIVNVNIYPDEMATLADYVLPEKLFLEGGPSIGFSKSFDLTMRINWIDGLPPVHPGVKSEKDIVRELAYKIGEKLGISRDILESEFLSEYFTIPKEEALRRMVETYNEKTGATITLDYLASIKVYSTPWKPMDLRKLKTSSGRIEILPVELAEHGYDPLPSWRDEYTYDYLSDGEFVLVTSVFAMNRHSKTVNNDWLRYFLKKHHADKIWIHPIAARRLGVQEGDYVLVEFSRPFNKDLLVTTPSFRLLARVHVTESVRPDVVFVPHGTGQLSHFMSSYAFGPLGGDSVVKPVMIHYGDPAASSRDQDVIVRVMKHA